MIDFKNLHKGFGNREILKGINLHIAKGKTTVILGISGGGKSTIIKHLVGLLQADEGEIWIEGQEIDSANEKQMRSIRKEIGFLFQSGALFDSMNVFENVAFTLREHTSMNEEEITQKVHEKLSMVGLDAKLVAELFPDELSGGMRKRVGLARTIALEPKVILYDEPTSGLDPITSDHVTQMIINLQKRLDVTSILISHDIKESFKAGDFFAMLYDGKIVEYGDANHMKNSSHPAVQQFLNAQSQGPIQFS